MKSFFSFIGIFTLIRLAAAPSFGLGVDEAHYFLYAQRLDLSYIDHPPLVGWAHVPLYKLFGASELLVRLPAILLFAAASFLCYHFVLDFCRSRAAALLSVIALNCSFIFNAVSLMLLPDNFLLVLIFPLLTVIKKIERTGQTRDYVYLGLILGTAGLAKYTAILLVPPLLLYFLLKKSYDRLFSGRMLLAATIALLMVSPVFYWNLKHNFISFQYQTGHILGSSGLSLKSFLLSLLYQAGAYSPFLFVIAVYGFFRALKSQDDLMRLACLFGGMLMLFFLGTSFREPVLPHWPSLFYILFIPIGASFLFIDKSRLKRGVLFFSVSISLLLTLFLYAELKWKWFAFPDYRSPFRDIYGFKEITRAADAVMRENPNTRKAVAVTNWTMASRMMYYGLPYGWDVVVADRRFDQFDLWQKEPAVGRDLLFVNTRFFHKDISRTYKCEDCVPVKSLDIILNGAKVDSINFVWCRNFQGIKP